MKTFIKSVITLVLFIYLGNWSIGKVVQDMNHYRDLATPKEADETIDYGPPVTAAFIEPDVPWTPAAGKERDEDMIMEEMDELLTIRRITASDPYTAYSFVPSRCMKCHEEDGPGTYFYGMEDFNKDQLFATKDGLVLRSWTLHGMAPTLRYDFLVTHAKKVPFEVGGTGEQILKLAQ